MLQNTITKPGKKATALLLCAAVFMTMFAQFFSAITAPINAAANGNAVPELKTFDDLTGKTIAMLTGAPFEELVKAKNPDIGDIQYFSTVADMRLALKSGKIDAFVTNNAVATMMVNQDNTLAEYPESLGDTYYGYAFQKGDPLCIEWQAAYDSISKERIDELWDIWLGTDESKKVLPAQDWSGSNGTVKVAACDSLPPMSSIGEGGEVTGFDIAVMLEMAKAMDVHIDFTGMEFSVIMAEVESGKAQVGTGSIMMLEERKKLVDFVPYHDASFIMVVRAEEAASPRQVTTISEPELMTFSDLTGKTVAMLTGAPFEELIRERNPDVGDIQYFSSVADMLLALKTHKVDAFLNNNAIATMMMNQDSGIAVFPESLGETAFGFAFKKGDPEREKWQMAYDSISKERINELWDIWLGTDESKKVLPAQDWSGANGTVKVAACDSAPPMSYVGDNGELVGFDIAVMLEIAKQLDVHLEFTRMEFASVMSEVESGKAQVGTASIVISDERKKLVDFVPYHDASFVLVVRAEEKQKVVTAPEFTELSELNGKTFGLVNGSPFAEIIESKVSDVKEYQYFSSIPDMALALKAGKIDAFLTGDVVAETMINQDEKLAAFPVPFGELEVAFALPKDSPDTGNWQAALEKLGEERIQELYEIWTGTDDGKKVLPEQDWPGANGTVRVASSDSVPPVSYVADNGRLEGLEIAVLLEMAKILDVHLDFSGMDLSSILASLETGKSDIANSCLVVSGERQKILDLVPYHKGTYVLVVRAKEKVVTVPEFTSLSELNGKTFGMQNGSAYGEIIESKVNEIGEYSYYSTIPDMSLALKSGKIDAFLAMDSIADVITAQDSSITVFPEPFGETYMAFTFRKNDPRSAEWQAALEKIGDQRVQELYEIWTGTDESKKVIPEQDWAGANGTLKVGSCDTVVPLSYISDDGKLVGLEIALMLEIAREMDVHLEFTGMEFSAVLSALQSGKIDIANPVAVTAERKEMLDMVPYRKTQYLLVVRAVEQTVEQPTFADNLKASFERTFITDSRWKMILLGLGRTVIMAICAGTLGTLLGFGLVLLRHKNNFIINKLIAAYSSLITGIPVVVILMVMYYIVFGKLDAPALIVAIIGFTIIFGARAYGLIHNAVMAVDDGQREAALALGYTEKLAFRRVILPQSKSIYFPTLKTQFVMLLKETSVAGYITVLEMTRAVDLVRSRTMEAFFPLITAAVIYYILTWLLTKIITSAENAFDKKREQRKIKGVD